MPVDGYVRLAVAGAHRRGQPLHRSLLQTGARFVRACQTAARYRFVALLDLDPPRPGLVRDDERAGSAYVEIYDLPMAGFGTLVASVAQEGPVATFSRDIVPERTGRVGYALRVSPDHFDDPMTRPCTNLLKWSNVG